MIYICTFVIFFIKQAQAKIFLYLAKLFRTRPEGLNYFAPAKFSAVQSSNLIGPARPSMQYPVAKEKPEFSVATRKITHSCFTSSFRGCVFQILHSDCSWAYCLLITFLGYLKSCIRIIFFRWNVKRFL